MSQTETDNTKQPETVGELINRLAHQDRKLSGHYDRSSVEELKRLFRTKQEATLLANDVVRAAWGLVHTAYLECLNVTKE